MPIGDLSSKVSPTASKQVNDKNNPPDYEDGFGDDDDDGFESLFDDIDLDDFGSSSPSSGGSSLDSFGSFGSFGSSGSSFGSSSSGFGGSSFGSSFGGFGSSSGGFGGSSSGFGGFGVLGQQQPQQPPKPKKPDALDVTIEAVGEASVSFGRVFVSMIKSAQSRNADDIAIFSKNMLLTGLGLTGAATVMYLIGISGGLPAMRSLALKTGISSLLCVGTGLVGIGGAALRIISKGEYEGQGIEDIPEIQNNMFSSSSSDDEDTDDFSDSDYDDIFGDLFGDDEEEEEESFDDFDFSSIKVNQEEPKVEDVPTINTEKSLQEIEEDYTSMIENIQANQPLLTREFLFNTFKGYFPLNTPGFSKRTEIHQGTEEFTLLETLCTQAIAAAAKKDISEINSRLTKATDTYFCYELRMDRVKGLNKLDDIAREVEAYFRDNAEDYSVNATVNIERDDYKIVVTKGVNAIVTFGDCFQLVEVSEYIKNTKNRLPIIAGIDDYGYVILADAKNYTTMLIAGKPRSGKSWYVDSILLSLMTFNTPEDIQFLIIDPKESNLFKTIALMPHVCGIHNDKNILQIMDDLINIEGARRKKLLADNMCDDIWDLRERKGVKLPVLYLVIDEVMTVLANLGKGPDAEFNRLMNIIITQLPSLGICLLFVPHRATGVVDKTARVNMAFTAAVRADEEVVKETLDIKKWDRALTQPGDIALKMSDLVGAKFVKGAALTDSDSKNVILITSIAKTFYKMGVDIPDMSTIGCGYNRNEKYIRETLELTSGHKRVQFDLDDTSDDLDSLIKESEIFD